MLLETSEKQVCFTIKTREFFVKDAGRVSSFHSSNKTCLLHFPRSYRLLKHNFRTSSTYLDNLPKKLQDNRFLVKIC